MPWKRLFVGVVLVVVAATVWVGATRRSEAAPETTGPSAKKEVGLPRTVPVVRAATQSIGDALTLSAEFTPYQNIDVMAKVAGYVKEIRVDVGSIVKQGDLLAVLEVPEMKDDLARADAAIQRNTAELQRARDELSRAQSAHEIAHLSYSRLDGVMKTRPGLVAQQEVDDAHSRDLESEAQVSAAKSNLTVIQQQIRLAQAERDKIVTMTNYTRVTAPFAGVITKRYADVGSMIQAGTASQIQARPVVTLAQVGKLRLSLPVPESAAPSVHAGDPVAVTVPALDRTFTGKVVRFARSVTLDTRTMETQVDVENPNYVLMPGMYATAKLSLGRAVDSITIPARAISSRDHAPYVYVVGTGRRIEKRPVSLGAQHEDRIEVARGLKPNEEVVIGNLSMIQPGEVVTAREISSADERGEKN